MIYGIDVFTQEQKDQYFTKLRRMVLETNFKDILNNEKLSPDEKEKEVDRRLIQIRSKKKRGSFELLQRKIAMDIWGGKMNETDICNKYKCDRYSVRYRVEKGVVNGKDWVVPKVSIELWDKYLWMYGVEIPTSSELSGPEKEKLSKTPWVELKSKKIMNTIEQIKTDLEKSREESKRLEFLLLSEVGKVEYVIQARQEFEVLKKKYYIGGDKEFLVYLSRVDDGSGNVKTTKTRTRTTITNDLIDKVMGMINENKKPAEIMKETGLSSSSISKIKTGVTKKT